MKELETKEAGQYSFAAVMDAQRRNTNNKSLYTDQQIRRALTVRDLLDTVFSYKSLYINYRKNFIAIKAEQARPKDPTYKQAIQCFEANGYTVAMTPQGIIVRLDKARV